VEKYIIQDKVVIHKLENNTFKNKFKRVTSDLAHTVKPFQLESNRVERILRCNVYTVRKIHAEFV
jgi:hypothetical protein